MEADEYMMTRVPPEASIAWWRVALMVSIFSLSLPTLVAGVQLAVASSARVFVTGTLAGGAILTIIAGIMGAIGSKTRLSSYMLTRIAFGTRGSVVVNVSLAIALLGWFGVNINLFSDATLHLLRDYGLYHGPVWPIDLGGGTIMTLTTFVGLKAIDRASLLVTPLIIVTLAVMLAAVLTHGSVFTLFARSPLHGMSLGDTISAIVGGSVIGAVISPDLTRFVDGWKSAVGGGIIAYLLCSSIVTVIGGMAALAIGQTDMLGVMMAIGLGAGAFVLVIGGSWIINALNLYSAILSLSVAAPRLRRGLTTLVCGLGGTVIAFYNILDHFLDFLFYLAILFVPVTGIVAVDIWSARPEAYEGEIREVSFQWSGLAAWVLGATVAIVGSEGYFSLTHIAVADSILVAALARWILSLRPFGGRNRHWQA